MPRWGGLGLAVLPETSGLRSVVCEITQEEESELDVVGLLEFRESEMRQLEQAHQLFCVMTPYLRISACMHPAHTLQLQSGRS